MFKYSYIYNIVIVMSLIIGITKEKKTKMGDIKQKACYRPNFKL